MAATAAADALQLAEPASPAALQQGAPAEKQELSQAPTAALALGSEAADQAAADDCVVCSKCKESLPRTDCIRKSISSYFCKVCNRVSKSFSDNLSGFPESFTDLTPAEKTEFFRSCKPLAEKHQGRNSGKGLFAEARCLLKKRVVVAVATRKRESRGGVYKPLSVWVKKGYTEQQVLASPSEEDPVLGTTYAVQLHSVSEEQVQERLEEELLELKACAKQRARVKAKLGQSSPRRCEG